MMSAPLKVVLIIWLSCVIASAQTSAPMVLNVTVETWDHTLVGGLSRDNFSVTIDKLPQTIVSFSDREVIASVGILIDISGSFDRGKRAAKFKQNLKEGLERLIRLSHPSNEYFVMTFGESTTLVQDWTSEYTSLTNTLDDLKFKGPTSFYDTIITAIPKLTTGRNAKQVLIVFSDGVDTNSKNELKQVREAVKRSDVLVYSIGFWEEYADMKLVYSQGLNDLNELTGYSGGRALFAKNESREAFIELFETVAAELRSHYQLVITPPEANGKEKWRKLTVKVARNDAKGRREKLFVRAKQGYYR